MTYVEILRARRVLLWYTGILLGCMILAVASIYANAHSHISMQGPNGGVRLSVAIGICSFMAWIVTTCVAPGLSAEHLTTAITWTRPQRRETIAWRYVAVDFLAIVLALFVMLAIIMLFLGAFGSAGAVVVDGDVPAAFALGLGCAAMWYGLVQLAAARVPARGALIAGLSWVAFLVVAGLWAMPMPPAIHALASVLNYANPLAWFGGVSTSHHGITHNAVDLPDAVRIAGVWLIGAVTTFIAVRLWATREV